MDALEPFDDAPLSVEEGFALFRGPVAQRYVLVDGCGVPLVPVLPVAVAGEADRAVLQRPVEIEEAVDGADDRLAEPLAGGAHPGGVVEREAVRLADVGCARPG